MKHHRSVLKLSQFLTYVLGRRPDEFGLVPDEGGYVKLKDLMKVMGEEEGWRHVRASHVQEVQYAVHPSVIEMENKRIRAGDRSSLLLPKIPLVVPKLLYYPIRQRAYPVIFEKGVAAGLSGGPVILTEDIDFAGRLGRRIDQNPVILTIHTAETLKKGVDIKQFGKLFLSDRVPLGCFSGPPLSKDRLSEKKPNKSNGPEKPKTPGSYLLDLHVEPTAKDKVQRGKGKRKNAWKRDRKHRNRNKDFG